jgi:hypothetical protein
MYRNYFCTGEGSLDYPDCMAAVDLGFMTRRGDGKLTGGDYFFHVTEAGKAHVRANAKPLPKLTRSQQRYESFLNSDCGLSFREWLSSGRREAR